MEENLKQLTVEQAGKIIRIAIVGPESTGKTTLAKQLAERFNTEWIPEFARDYLQQKWDKSGKICEPSDLLPIAAGQISLENKAVSKANQLLFTDTSVLQTKVYSDIYYGTTDPLLEKAAKKNKYDLFILTGIDVPWERDDLRDRPQDRVEIYNRFKSALEQLQEPYIEVSGSPGTRLESASKTIEELASIKASGFSSQDYIQISKKGIRPEHILEQISIFSNGIPKTLLDRPATPGDGIVKLAKEQFQQYADYFDSHKHKLRLEKFIPASGAASRMFKFLIEFLNNFNPESETINAYINKSKAADLTVFLAGLEKFPFFDAVIEKLAEINPEYNTWEKTEKIYHFVKVLLEPEYFNFSNKPKGVLPFHKYKSHIATPVEEHLNETIFYSTGSGNATNLHFTVSDSHLPLFQEIVDRAKDKTEKLSGNSLNVTFSYQDPSTDTIAVDMDNQPFRDKNGELVFRPGGHGALIRNLGNLDADLIFIKNIDNVIQNHLAEIALYKKALAGMLTEIQNETFDALQMLENDNVEEQQIQEIDPLLKKINVEMPEDFSKYTLSNKVEFIRKMLDRPIRVCGMVKNEGEPGGGPFWVRNAKGNLSLQIVESSQVDLANPGQAAIMGKSTHFNPVDLVCGTRNYKGEKFDLVKYVDHNSGFIVEKTKNGKPLKGYELPGLWNGAMAKWITVFVEVPLITFNPVKTVNDLLKPAHQP